MTIRRLALAAAAMAAAWMFALSLPVYADSHEETEAAETAPEAEEEHEEHAESRGDDDHHDSDEAHEHKDEDHDKKDKKESPEAKVKKRASPEAVNKKKASPEALRERMEAMRQRMERARHLPLERMRAMMIEETKRAAHSMMKGVSPEKAKQVEMSAVKRIHEIQKLAEEKLRAMFMQQMRGRMESMAEGRGGPTAGVFEGRISAEQIRARMIEETKRAVQEKMKGLPPEEAHKLEAAGMKRIQEIQKLPEEKLRAMPMEKMSERMRGGMGQMRRGMARIRRGMAQKAGRIRVNMNRLRGKSGDRFEAFQLEHIPVQHAAEMIDPLMPRNTRIAADPRTNKLLVMTTGEGMRIALAVLEEIDIPVEYDMREREERERERQERERDAEERRLRDDLEQDERRRRDGGRDAGALPRYDYERRGLRGGDAAGGWFSVDSFNPYAPANRIEGMLIEKSDEHIVIRIEGVEEPMSVRLPVVRVGDDWTVKGNLANKLKEVATGDAVILEWWEAEGVLYLQNIALLEEKRREREETYLFE